jgi:hypothetical protein
MAGSTRIAGVAAAEHPSFPPTDQKLKFILHRFVLKN